MGNAVSYCRAMLWQVYIYTSLQKEKSSMTGPWKDDGVMTSGTGWLSGRDGTQDVFLYIYKRLTIDRRSHQRCAINLHLTRICEPVD